MRTILVFLFLLSLAGGAGAQTRADSLQTELTRASAFNKASQTQLDKTRALLVRLRGELAQAGVGVWTFVFPVAAPWHAVATLPADSGWAHIVLDSAGVVKDSASYWMPRRQ